MTQQKKNSFSVPASGSLLIPESDFSLSSQLERDPVDSGSMNLGRRYSLCHLTVCVML